MSNKSLKVTASVVKYDNGEVIRLAAPGARPVQFGRNKAQKYLAHEAAIKHFAKTGRAPDGYTLGEYEGHTTLVLEADGRVPVSLGQSRARLITAAIKDITAWAAS